jgi:enoyl-CoA hydratase/carnithine racemase
MVLQLRDTMDSLPAATRVVVLDGEGRHFSAGLDLTELRERDAAEGLFHSRTWHQAFDRLQFARVPIIAVLHGAVVGAASSWRVPRISGSPSDRPSMRCPRARGGSSWAAAARCASPSWWACRWMTDMMLTGRVYDAQDGLRVGFSQYLVDDGQGLAQALELAAKVAGNAPMSNYAVMHALPRIASMSLEDGALMESMIAGIAQADEGAKSRLRAFLETGANKVRAPGQ